MKAIANARAPRKPDKERSKSPSEAPPVRQTETCEVLHPVFPRPPKTTIDVLRRNKFIGRLHRHIVALLVPVEIALEEARLTAPDLTRNAFLELLERNNIRVFANIDQFVKARAAIVSAAAISKKAFH